MSTLVYRTPPTAWGGPFGHAVRVFAPDDFVVDEVVDFAPDGFGEHALLHVRKRGVNTQWLARRLASYAKARARDVGYCGLKDRHAVTTQWFSVPSAIVNPVDWSGFEEDGVEILTVASHGRKLRPGSHSANRFSITLRQIQAEESPITACLTRIKQHGLPNYFGAQRFGHNGNNLANAQAWLLDRGRKPDRVQRGMWLSALRSQLFNGILADRVQDGSWCQLLPGERVMLNGSRSVFTATVDETLRARCRDQDVHPSGPLAGAGRSGCEDEALAYEMVRLAQHSDLLEALERQGSKADRRALRVSVPDLTWAFEDEGLDAKGDKQCILKLQFSLPSGSFATVLLDEIVQSQEAIEP